MKQKYKTLLAFLTASIIPALYLAVVYPLSGVRDWRSVIGTFFVAYYFAAAATVLLGLPAFLILRKLKLVAWWSSLGGGALVGAVTDVAVTSGRVNDIQSLLRFATLGAIAGLAFWLVWRSWSSAASHGIHNVA
jgi:hypothetical protein